MAVVENTPITELITTLPGYDPHRDADGFYFDEDEAAKWIYLWENTLLHVEGHLAGEPYLLADHEKGIIANLFGWKDSATGHRRFRDVFYFVPQGNTKSTFAAGLIVLVLAFDPQPAAQLYSTGASRDQAGVVRRLAKMMVQASPLLSGMAQIYQNSIVFSNRAYKALAAEAKTVHGITPYLTVNDEIHAHTTMEFLEVVRQKGRKIANSIRVYISTSDFQREGSFCNLLHDRAKQIARGDISVPSFLPAIYEVSSEALEADPDCWEDEDVWRAANPMMGVSISLMDFREGYDEAKHSPALLNNWKRLCLNIRTESEERLLDMGNWVELCGGEIDFEKYKGKQCVGVGLDLGNTSDLTALCLLFERDDAKDANPEYDALWFHWTPKAKAEERQRKDLGADYVSWGGAGWLELTEGNETDYGHIENRIVEIGKDYGLGKIAADRLFQGAQLCQGLMNNHGFEVEAFGQGFLDMAAPTKEFVSIVNTGRLHHGDNPLMRWQAANLQGKMDDAGNIKPSKSKSGNKIDGCVACIMALGMAMKREEPPESMLEKHHGILYV